MADPVYTLKIDGHTPVTGLRVPLSSYELNFDGPAALKFIVQADWRFPPYGPDAVVEFYVDGLRRFRGLLNPGRPIAGRNESYIEFEAVDQSDWAARIFPKNQFGDYSFTLSPNPLGEVVAQYLAFAQVQEMLNDCGIDADDVGYGGGADQVECFPVSLNSASIDGAMRAIAAAAPGVGVYLDCTTNPPQYRFVNLYGAPSYNLSIDTVRLEKLDLTVSIDGRCGAVQTLAGSTTGQTQFTLDRSQILKPAWDRRPDAQGLLPERLWSYDDANVIKQDGTRGDRWDFFRLWSFEDAPLPPSPDSPISVQIRIAHSDDQPDRDEWKPIQIMPGGIDFEKKTVLLKEPAIRRGIRNSALFSRVRAAARFNIHEPGRCLYKEATVRMAWSSQENGSAPISIPSIRYPEVGYSGRVYQMAPRRGATVRLVNVPAGVRREKWVPYAHAQLSEPAISGEIPIVGHLPSSLWGLARRINLTSASNGPTGYEQLLAPIKGLRVDFSPNAPTATLQLSLDTADLLKESAS